MAKSEQEDGEKNTEEAMTEQQREGVNVLKSIIDPIHSDIAALGSMIKSNSLLIQEMAKQRNESLIPKELQALLPDIIKGGIDAVVAIFTTPETSAAAGAKGIFGEDMMEVYKTQFKRGLALNNDIIEANLKKINVDIKMMEKRLADEI